jgi:hypothetical protein
MRIKPYVPFAVALIGLFAFHKIRQHNADSASLDRRIDNQEEAKIGDPHMVTEAVRSSRRSVRNRLWWLPSVITGLITAAMALFVITASNPPVNDTSSIAMALDNFAIKDGVWVSIGIDVEPPNPILGCNKYAHFVVDFMAPPGFSETDWIKLQSDTQKIRFAVMLVFPHVYGFQEDRHSIYEPEFPPIQQEAVQFSGGYGLTLIRSYNPVVRNHWTSDIGWEISFYADVVSRQGFGSCWVQLPSLMGPSASNAQIAASELLNHPSNKIDFYYDIGPAVEGVKDPPISSPLWSPLITSGSISLDGADIDFSNTRPTPTDGISTWNCGQRGQPDDCAAVVSIEAPWRDAAYNGALLFAGALLALTIELLLRGWDRRHDQIAKSSKDGRQTALK